MSSYHTLSITVTISLAHAKKHTHKYMYIVCVIKMYKLSQNIHLENVSICLSMDEGKKGSICFFVP